MKRGVAAREKALTTEMGHRQEKDELRAQLNQMCEKLRHYKALSTRHQHQQHSQPQQHSHHSHHLQPQQHSQTSQHSHQQPPPQPPQPLQPVQRNGGAAMFRGAPSGPSTVFANTAWQGSALPPPPKLEIVYHDLHGGGAGAGVSGW